MTWHEPSPGTYKAKGHGSILTVTRTGDRADLWTIQIDFGLYRPLLSAAEQFTGTPEAAQVQALTRLHTLGQSLRADAADLAASMSRTIQRPMAEVVT